MSLVFAERKKKKTKTKAQLMPLPEVRAPPSFRYTIKHSTHYRFSSVPDFTPDDVELVSASCRLLIEPFGQPFATGSTLLNHGFVRMRHRCLGEGAAMTQIKVNTFGNETPHRTSTGTAIHHPLTFHSFVILIGQSAMQIRTQSTAHRVPLCILGTRPIVRTQGICSSHRRSSSQITRFRSPMAIMIHQCRSLSDCFVNFIQSEFLSTSFDSRHTIHATREIMRSCSHVNVIFRCICCA